MKKLYNAWLTSLFLLSVSVVYSQVPGRELKKAAHHPMQYYISLPANWSPKSKWPVVIALEQAEKQFQKNAERFMTARKDMPFIIVVPFITTNGQQGQRDPAVYPYSKAVWDTIDKISICRFDMDGLQNIITDMKENYGGSDKVFITGFEAGTHLLWATLFQHPEWLYAAAPVAGNYRSRCMENNSFSQDKSIGQLPIKNFTGSDDKDFKVNGRIYNQYLEAKNLALAHGYKNISEADVQGKGHVPLPENVLEFFYTVWKNIKK